MLHRQVELAQYVSLAYTDALVTAGVTASVGTVGDSYDNALAETVNGLYKTELVKRQRPWKGFDDLEIATAEWVDWFNHRRLLGSIGHIPPAEAEANYHRQQRESAIDA